MTNHLSIDQFLEMAADMPDIEAIQEVDLRLLRIEEERRELVRKKDPEYANPLLAVLNTDETRLRGERHLFVTRLERKKWSKAVRALWGDEGLEQCLIWFEVMGEPDIQQIPLRPRSKAA